MATPPVSLNPDVVQHHAAGVGISQAMELQAAAAFAHFQNDPEKLRAALAALVEEYGSASVALNADYYAALRDAAKVQSRFRVPVVDPAPAGLVDATLRYEMASSSGASDGLESRLTGAAQKLAANAGRRELFTAMNADPEAERWARVCSPGACYFCRMIASRGARFRTDRNFDAHAHDNCTLEPIFKRSEYDPPPGVIADQRLWAEVTHGLHGQDAINAFRRAIYAQQGA